MGLGWYVGGPPVRYSDDRVMTECVSDGVASYVDAASSMILFHALFLAVSLTAEACALDGPWHVARKAWRIRYA